MTQLEIPVPAGQDSFCDLLQIVVEQNDSARYKWSLHQYGPERFGLVCSFGTADCHRFVYHGQFTSETRLLLSDYRGAFYYLSGLLLGLLGLLTGCLAAVFYAGSVAALIAKPESLSLLLLTPVFLLPYYFLIRPFYRHRYREAESFARQAAGV